MDSIFLKNIRCFYDEQTVPIRPITILVGENSSGKSTFLAATRIAWDLCQGKKRIDFNEDPFNLGSFEQIATYRGGKAGRAKEFFVGAEFDLRKNRNSNKLKKISIQGTFIQDSGKPILSNWLFQSSDYRLEIKFGDSDKDVIFLVKTPSGDLEIREFPFLIFPSDFGVDIFSYLRFIIQDIKRFAKNYKGKIPKKEDISLFVELGIAVSETFGSRPYAIAPIRTRPLINYDPLKDIPSPEGSHIPIILARMSATDINAWTKLRDSLDSFGRASGLFDDVDVRRIGRKEGDPFQLRIKISGPPFNLVHVGYGVSQVLPIIVDALQKPRGTTFLLQQPEVHLHPKAQAELGSFLASTAKLGEKRFIIETHSDYLIDRIRMDVRDNEYLSENDVVILYFERSGGTVNISPIYIDKNGNLINTPNTYRGFFLEEERRIILG
jgi:predicted ATPase